MDNKVIIPFLSNNSYLSCTVGQVETSVRISAMVTGIAGFEPRLGHFPFILFPFIIFPSAPTGCNTLVLHQLGAIHWSCTNWVQYIGPATWCNANTIAPSLAYIRGSLLDNKVFYQPEPSRQVVNWVSTTLYLEGLMVWRRTCLKLVSSSMHTVKYSSATEYSCDLS